MRRSGFTPGIRPIRNIVPPKTGMALSLLVAVSAFMWPAAPVQGQSLHERILADERQDQMNEIIRQERNLRNMQQRPSDPEPRRNQRREPRGPSESKLKADKVNGIMNLARAASDRGDLREALRLAREASPIAQNAKFKVELENWIRALEAAIAHNEMWEASTALRKDANVAFDRGDMGGALALYRRALAINPDCLDEKGKKWVQDLDVRLKASGSMQRTLDTFAQSLQAAPSAGALDFMPGNTLAVDAHEVPSGLPKSVEESIPPTPAGDRVRKGFQAIADHDWVVAKAWFEDALNREPGDPGLQRLVDLAQFTLQKNREKTTPSPPPERMSADEIAAKTAIIGNALEAAMNEDFDKSLNDYLDKHPEVKGEQIQPPPTAAEPKPASDQPMPLPPKAEIKFSWKAFADALFKPLPKSKYPQVGSARG